ncbi:MAG: hypothetical protein Fur009_4550 [Candidatus Microgenomates bacterium]
MKKILKITTLIILFLFYTSSIFAQQISLSLTPPLIETTIKPGKSIMIAYTIKNYGDPTYLKTKVISFEPKDNLGNIRLKNNLEGPVRFDLDNADLQLERPFFLKTGESQQILLRIRIPDGAPEGDYYYTLLAETIPQEGINGSTSIAKVSIGANILVTITNTGIINIKPKIVIFDVLTNLKIFGKKINIFDSFDKIPIVLILENKGKNLIKPQGEINIKDFFAHNFKYQIIPKNILAESQRLLEATPSVTIENNYNLKNTSLILSGFFIGPYKLSTQINFGENSPEVFAKTQFFAFPFKLSAISLFLIVIIIYIIKKLPKNIDEE